ncbi:hypothetical protein K525DRAFT_272843 [Schizophyllum commune Loenen D]|nr:hypothetical protein K525DRAFT_272843 [Schizophyllum commune Loenen D]
MASTESIGCSSHLGDEAEATEDDADIADTSTRQETPPPHADQTTEPSGASWTHLNTPAHASDTSAPCDESKIPEIALANKFIDLLKAAALDGGLEHLDNDVLEALLHPPHGITELTPNERLSIDIYLAVTNASEATYDAVRSALQRDKRCKHISVLSYHSVKALVRRVSGCHE